MNRYPSSLLFPIAVVALALLVAACGSTAPPPSSASPSSAAASASTAVSAAPSDTPEPTGTPEPTETPEPEPTETPEPERTEEPVYQPIEELEVGQCYVSINDADDGMTLAAQLVECSELHTSEVFAVAELEGGADAPYPGEDAIDIDSTNLCDEAFDAYIGIPYLLSRFEYVYFVPTEETWTFGDREVICVIEEKGEMLEESVRGSGN